MIWFSSIISIPEVVWGIIQKVLYILWNWKACVSKESNGQMSYCDGEKIRSSQLTTIYYENNKRRA